MLNAHRGFTLLELLAVMAIVAVLVTAIATPFVAVNQRNGLWVGKPWISAALVVAAVALSQVLAGLGDQESGSLSLPPPP